MLTSKIKQTPWHSWCNSEVSDGCKLCVQGRKLVLFITGLCAQRCFYCPISEQKFAKDEVFANEWKVSDPNNPIELIEEAQLTEAHGAGITGGDPLADINRCCKYIQLLKDKFGKKFHIHLYTPLQLVNSERLQALYNAGLDEIRFHPNLDDQELWPRLNLAKKFDWRIGVEIPVIPGYETKIKNLIDFIVNKVDFLNLNELELSDTQAQHYKLGALGFKQKDDISYAVAGSAELAKNILKYAQDKGLAAHFCTAKLKNHVQLNNRIKLRAKHVALPSDKITSEGLLLRGCIYLQAIKPGIDYNNQFKRINKEEIIKKLRDCCDTLKQKFKIQQIMVDEKKLRLLTSINFISKNAAKLKKSNLVPAIVEEYPTEEGLEVEISFL